MVKTGSDSCRGFFLVALLLSCGGALVGCTREQVGPTPVPILIGATSVAPTQGRSDVQPTIRQIGAQP